MNCFGRPDHAGEPQDSQGGQGREPAARRAGGGNGCWLSAPWVRPVDWRCAEVCFHIVLVVKRMSSAVFRLSVFAPERTGNAFVFVVVMDGSYSWPTAMVCRLTGPRRFSPPNHATDFEIFFSRWKVKHARKKNGRGLR